MVISYIYVVQTLKLHSNTMEISLEYALNTIEMKQIMQISIEIYTREMRFKWYFNGLKK